MDHVRRTPPMVDGAAAARVRACVLVASLVFVAALVGIGSRQAEPLSAFWPANPLLLGLFVRVPSLARPPSWIAATAGFLAADLVTGSTLETTVLLTLGNLVGVAVGLRAFRMLSDDDRRLRRTSSVLYVFAACVVGAGGAAMVGALIGPILFDFDPATSWIRWLASELANSMAILPVLLSMPAWPGLRALLRRPRRLVPAHLEGMAIPVALLALSFGAGLLVDGPAALTFPVPALLWCALRTGVFETTLLTLVSIAWTMVAIHAGGIEFLTTAPTLRVILSVQIGLALVAMGPIAIAATMAELERTNASLRRATAAAEAATEAKAAFVANISHELRTPLSAVIGYARLLDDSQLDLQQREAVDAIVGSGDHLLGVINQVLDFSKVEADRASIERHPFTLTDVVESAQQVVSGAAADKGLDLRLDVDEDVPVRLVGDAGRLRQVLVNLLANAVKFTERGHVSLEVRTTDPVHDGVVGLAFDVVDTGIGVPADGREQLFDAFAQADASIDRRFGGTGLGLTISQRLARRMGGEITVEDAPAPGAWFRLTITLPVAPPQRSAGARSPVVVDDAAAGGAGAARVLVADDNVVTQRLFAAMLARFGVVPLCASNGAEAVATVLRQPIDVVIMDVQMPLMDGLSATREIRRSDPPGGQPRIVIATAGTSPGEQAEALVAGADEQLLKPVTPEQLARTVAAARPRPAPAAVDPAGAAPAPCGTATPGDSASPAGGILDLERFDDLAEVFPGDGLGAFVDRWHAHAVDELAAIRAAAAAGDRPQVAAASHTLRGGGHAVAVAVVVRAANELERAARSGADLAAPLAGVADAVALGAAAARRRVTQLRATT